MRRIQLPATLARWLENKCNQAEHVLNPQRAQLPDAVIWQRGAAEDCVTVSKDEDFAQLTVARPKPVEVVWLRIGNCRTSVLLAVKEKPCH